MPLQSDRLLNHCFEEISQSYTPRDAIIYALGIGLGRNPCDRDDLNCLLEDSLAIVPAFAVTLASPGMWIAAPEFGVDFVKLVHAEQAAWFHAPLPSAAEVIGRARIVSLVDRGSGRGAVLVLERSIHDAVSGMHYCTLEQTLLLRGDGGFGGPSPTPVPTVIPDREPDSRVVVPVSPRAALIYRLSGDKNPLHADPDIARRAGFDRPILHGLASYAMAGVAVARACGHPPTHFRALQCRFSGVIFPGDAVEFCIWHDDDRAMFQAFVGERKVLDQGLISFGGAK
ncbi:acyl dehydratase [Nitrobacteraceae bacterium AZCC 2161]